MSSQAIYRTHRLAMSAKAILEVAQSYTNEMPEGPLKRSFQQHLLFATTALEDLAEDFNERTVDA